MEKKALKRIFEFLEEKGEHNAPLIWKLINDIPITEKDLDFEGDLILTYSDIESLPEGLNVRGDLDLFGSKLASLPEGLKVRGYLDLRYSSIESLPKGLKVRDLHIWDTSLTKYTDEELREMIKPGFIKGKIYRI
jgi:hypothetical protein